MSTLQAKGKASEYQSLNENTNQSSAHETDLYLAFN